MDKDKKLKEIYKELADIFPEARILNIDMDPNVMKITVSSSHYIIMDPVKIKESEDK